ncbi:MAG: hypothetical protein A2Y93_11970 [Chloroflexi bacterium RBG_13_68_17]|nr:MAG: hypothetical protein A2Y93_11970 [Chloroflexi bacterium RBG_13_68_17]
MAESGTLALVGAGEFLESMRAVDAELLRRAGARRVAILPTASAPDGPGVPERWAAMGVAHFTALGAVARAVMAVDRSSCQAPDLAAQAQEADLVYFSGGKPAYLVETLRDSLVWAAVLSVLARGGLVAGCSAGAMALGGWVPDRPTLRRPSFWRPGLGLVPQTVILPHFDEIPPLITAGLAAVAPRGATLIGIAGSTALVGRDAVWTVLGERGVRVRAQGRDESLRSGAAVRL